VAESLAQQIADQIREVITDGTLKADERLPKEDDLAKHFGVSRPTIREALKRLSAQNLIRSRRGPAGGTFVNRPTCEELSSDVTTAAALLVSMGEVEIAEVMEARREFEVVCARLAAERRLTSELDVMAAEIELQKDSTLADAEFCASDVRFHRALADASHNPAIRFAMFSVIEALQSIDKLEKLRCREREAIVEQHESILKALSARDADGAAAAVADQIEYLLERFNVALGWTYVQRLVEREQAQDVPDQPGITSGVATTPSQDSDVASGSDQPA
jgi:DNA-binding FadR family transcriptional regulator